MQKKTAAAIALGALAGMTSANNMPKGTVHERRI